jgi:hypothetical protein
MKYAQFRLWALPRTPRELSSTAMLLGSLRKAGWLRSATLQRPQDGTGAPVPWWPYSAITWLGSVLTGDEAVFEYGSGQSTRWYASRVKAVVSVEHSEEWASWVRADLPANCSLLVRERTDDVASSPYVGAVAEAPAGVDIAVVDGRDRVACLLRAKDHIRPDGLLVLDDSHRDKYRPGLVALHEEGFARIDFRGLVAGGHGFGCLSVFSRDMHGWLRKADYPQEFRTLPSRAPWSL